MNYHLDLFGAMLSKTRIQLNLTLEEASKLTYVNAETIRRIEHGKVIPRVDTLDALSPIYKLDLNSLLLKYRLNDYSIFYDIKNRLESKFDRNELHSLDIELEELTTLLIHTDNLYYRNHIKQLILLIQSIILHKKDNNLEEALKKSKESIRISTPNFNLDNYSEFSYSSMELRILMNISLVLHRLSLEDKYLEILEFCIERNELDAGIYSKLCHNLAGAYIRHKEYEKALSFSNKGIDFCNRTRKFEGLNLLYYNKGIAEYRLNEIEYIKSLRTSISLCEAFHQNELKSIMINNCREVFNIEL